MTYTAEMKNEDFVINSFRKAVKNPENINNWIDWPHDGINWNFVEADVFLDVKEAGVDIGCDLGWFVECLMREQIEFGMVDDNKGVAA